MPTEDIFVRLSEKFTMKMMKKDACRSTEEWRVHLKDPQHAFEFIKTYERLENVTYIVYRTVKPRRYVMLKGWMCQFSQVNKIKSSKRDTKCDASILIKIKKITPKTRSTDPFIKWNPPLNAEVKVNKKHTHDSDDKDTLTLLRVKPETKINFIQMFYDGLKPRVAKRLNEENIKTHENSQQLLANVSVCPTHRQMEEGIFERYDPFLKLKEKSQEYLQRGNIIVIKDDNPWVILTITPIMKKIQELSKTSDIVFINSIVVHKHGYPMVTTMLIPTSVGALPIAMFLHKEKSTSCFTKAFTLLNETCTAVFGGHNFPQLFITDESNAVKEALEEVWPKSKQMLCCFHIIKTEWQWLKAHGEKEMKSISYIMALFQNVLLARDDEEEREAVSKLYSFTDLNPQYTQRFSEFYEKRKMLLINKPSNIEINFCELTIGILKVVILEKINSHNIFELVDFIMCTLEDYLKNELPKCITLKKSNPDFILYKTLLQDIDPLALPNIKEQVYKVQGDKVANAKTDPCTDGNMNAFCKHQIISQLRDKIAFEDPPKINYDQLSKIVSLPDICIPQDEDSSRSTELNDESNGSEQFDDLMEITDNTVKIEEIPDYQNMFQLPSPQSCLEQNKKLIHELCESIKSGIDSCEMSNRVVEELKVILDKIVNKKIQ